MLDQINKMFRISKCHQPKCWMTLSSVNIDENTQKCHFLNQFEPIPVSLKKSTCQKHMKHFHHYKMFHFSTSLQNKQNR